MMYSWTDVAQRTERVYDGITGALPEEDFYGEHVSAAWSATRGRAGLQSFALIDRLKRYYGCGIWAGKLFCLCVIVDYLLFVFLELWAPRAGIDIAKDWPRKKIEGAAVAAPESKPMRKRSARESVGRRDRRVS